MPGYRKHLSQVFGEEFLAEATRQDRTLTPIIKMIRDKDWETLRKSNKYFYSLRKDLAVTSSGCMLYDNKLVIPSNLKQFVIDAIHQTHPGQAGMLSLGNLVWFPCIHRSLTSKAQACEECTKQDCKLLKQPVLSPAAIWDMEQDSEPELNIQYREEAQKESRPGINITSENDDSENAPLLSPMRTPEEKRQMKRMQQQMTQGPCTSATNTPGGENNLYSHEQIVSIAEKNQRAQQQKRRNNQRREATVKKLQPRKQHENQHLSPRRNRKHTMPQKDTHQKNAGKNAGKQNPNDTFLAKSQAAAHQQSKIQMERQQNRSFIKIDEKE